MVSLGNVHSHGTQKKAVSSVAFQGFNGFFVLLRIQVFSDNGVSHVGEMPADLMGASCFGLNIEQCGGAVHGQRTGAHRRPLGGCGFPIQGDAAVTSFKDPPCHESEVSFLDPLFGKSMAE